MKISVHTGNFIKLFGYEKGCAMIREAGFDGIELNFNDAWNQTEVRNGSFDHCVFEEETDKVIKAYESELAGIKKSGLTVFQAHAPFPPYVSGFSEFNERTPKIYENCIRLCGAAGIPHLVIHGISGEYDGSDMTKEEEIQKNIELYSSMIPALRETGVTVLLENIFWNVEEKAYNATCSDPDEAAMLIDTLNEMAGKECFGLCFDVGHCNLLDWDMATYIRTLGSRIKALHLHDNDGRGDWHGLPCTGTVCWKELCALLSEIGYKGVLNFETFSYYDLNRVAPSVVPVILRYIAGVGMELGKEIEACGKKCLTKKLCGDIIVYN